MSFTRLDPERKNSDGITLPVSTATLKMIIVAVWIAICGAFIGVLLSCFGPINGLTHGQLVVYLLREGTHGAGGALIGVFFYKLFSDLLMKHTRFAVICLVMGVVLVLFSYQLRL